jgi:hypothetical protein
MTPNTTEFELYGVGENHYLKKKIGKKNRKLKEMKAKNRGYKPHFGPEDFAFLTESFADISKVTGVEVPDELWRKIEGVVALFINLKECTTYTQFTAGIFLYVRDFYESSITKEIMDYISNLLNDSVLKSRMALMRLHPTGSRCYATLRIIGHSLRAIKLSDSFPN